MTVPVEWPDALRAYVEHNLGSPLEIEPLGGMSGGAVTRLRSRTAAVVLKRGRPAELWVYTRLATTLEMHGMTLPRLLWSLDEANGCWLLLEDIPHRLPRERWGADLEVLSLLWQLHTLPLDASALPPGHYRPGWPEEMTRDTLSLFAAATARELRPLLITARQAAEPLFRPLCPLSGDPNPRNWGLREDGQLVLYDWERFCFGSPAIDLAISVPGLGSSDAYRRTAERYLSASHHLVDAAAVAQLTREICIAKVWSVVEFLAHVATGAAQPNFPIDALLDQVPAWLKTELRT